MYHFTIQREVILVFDVLRYIRKNSNVAKRIDFVYDWAQGFITIWMPKPHISLINYAAYIIA